MKSFMLTLFITFSLCTCAFGADYMVTLKDGVEASELNIEPVLEEKNIYMCDEKNAQKLYSEGLANSISKDEPLILPDIENTVDFKSENLLVPMSSGYNDPYYSNELYYEQMSIMDYIDKYKPSGEVRIAVIDTGINREHIDFAHSKIETGYNFVTDSTDTTDVYRHGTMVASLICAAANDGVGVAGIAPSSTIIPLVSLTKIDGKNKGTTSNLIRAIRAAAEDYNCKIITTSLGVTTDTPEMKAAVDYALSKGIIVIAAAGNSGDNGDTSTASSLSYPASYEGVISVGATDSKYNRASYSQKNTAVDVVAFGGNLTMPSNIGKDRYVSIKGTSFSTPVIAGITALFVSAHPNISPDEFNYVLKASARDVGSVGTGDYMGYGMPDCMEMENAYSNLQAGGVYISPVYNYTLDYVSTIKNIKVCTKSEVKNAQLIVVYDGDYPGYEIFDISFEKGFAWASIHNMWEHNMKCFVIENMDTLKSLSDVRLN